MEPNGSNRAHTGHLEHDREHLQGANGVPKGNNRAHAGGHLQGIYRTCTLVQGTTGHVQDT